MDLIYKIRRFIERKNDLESLVKREYFKDKYNIDIGLYSYGCFDIKRIPNNTKIGRYCSFSNSCYILNGNHGLQYISLHPYLYNTSLGIVSEEKIQRTELVVEDDVWVGHNVIITPSVEFIGRGAVIAAGAVVTKNVEAYSIVGGNPAKLIRYRFNAETIEKIESTKWWTMDKNKFSSIIISGMAYEPEKIST
ncbi:CatB-related O-acetyltransferase [Pseudoalteromonas sp. MEBiC 03485]|uniref:CatB-related O-acetyltransferase n=1 Tax=unclassified Pseudoalteromonas TaxID=194690 RepID=UPI00145A0019|nr:CatB-related O-acetyltransferase [Pseudoalteromonas sp. MEBiC 03485]